MRQTKKIKTYTPYDTQTHSHTYTQTQKHTYTKTQIHTHTRILNQLFGVHALASFHIGKLGQHLANRHKPRPRIYPNSWKSMENDANHSVQDDHPVALPTSLAVGIRALR